MTKIPPATIEPSFDLPPTDEIELARNIIEKLGESKWSQPLIKKLNDPLTMKERRSFLFELIFGYRLHEAGISPTYETPGEGSSRIDFSFQSGNYEWLTELMRLDETDASRSATQKSGDITCRILCTPDAQSSPEEIKQSLEGEMLKAIERIIDKTTKGDKTHKFPPPERKIHAIVADISNFSDGGDIHDKRQIAFAPEAVSSDYRLQFQGRPIYGVFDNRNTRKNSHFIRERVHFLIFDSKYKSNKETKETIHIAANPHLFKSKEEVEAAFESFPLNPKKLI